MIIYFAAEATIQDIYMYVLLCDLFQAFGMNDTIGCYLDLQKGEIRWSKNGIDLGKAYDIPGHMRKERFFAAVVLKVSSN